MAEKKKTASVVAYRDGSKREFDAESWNQLPEHKYGWKQSAEEPEEVTALKREQAAQFNPELTEDQKTAQALTESADQLDRVRDGWKQPNDGLLALSEEVATDTEDTAADVKAREQRNAYTGEGYSEGDENVDQPKSAADLVNAISEAETAEDVDALVQNGETRKSVLAAQKARKAELKKG